MEKAKSIITGDAYKKPAKTEAGAFTTQGMLALPTYYTL